MEYLNLYDRQGNLLKEKGVRGAKNEHLVGIAIVFIENSNGEFLIQKTTPERDNVFATTGGHVTYGTTFEETIKNEIKEELGIDVSNDDVIEAATYVRTKVLQKVYYLKKDIDIKDIITQDSEVEYVEWMSKEKINQLILEKKFRESNILGYQYIIDNFK